MSQLLGPDGKPLEDPRKKAAQDLSKAMKTYAAANGTTPEGAILGLAVANDLYNPTKLEQLGAPQHIVKGLRHARKQEAVRRARDARRQHPATRRRPS